MTPGLRRPRGFTLLEIMIVVAVVAIVTGLALFAIGRIKERAARSLIENNLRQLYQAKEYCYSETGFTQLRSVRGLVLDGYLRPSTGEQLTSSRGLVGNLGWRYGSLVWPGHPVYAYRGTDPATVNTSDRANPTWTQSTGEVIWYPGPPGDSSSSVPPPVVNPPVVNPPVVNPPVVNPPVVNPPVVNPPVVNPPVVNPPATGGGNNVPPPQQPNPPQPSNGPGNSDFGHSHNPGNHGGGKGKG